MPDISDAPTPDFSIHSVEFEAGHDIDKTLNDAANLLKKQGLRVAGLVQVRGVETGECECRELYLRDLNTGEQHRISEERGAQAQGCHLDWQALTVIAQNLEQSLSKETDVLIINRFGHSESQGRGFRGAIEKAMMLGIQVVVSVRDEYMQEWRVFHGGLASTVAADANDILKVVISAEKSSRAT